METILLAIRHKFLTSWNSHLNKYFRQRKETFIQKYMGAIN